MSKATITSKASVGGADTAACEAHYIHNGQNTMHRLKRGDMNGFGSGIYDREHENKDMGRFLQRAGSGGTGRGDP